MADSLNRFAAIDSLTPLGSKSYDFEGIDAEDERIKDFQNLEPSMLESLAKNLTNVGIRVS